MNETSLLFLFENYGKDFVHNLDYLRGREGSKGVRTHVHTFFVEPQVTGVTANSTLVPCDR